MKNDTIGNNNQTRDEIHYEDELFPSSEIITEDNQPLFLITEIPNFKDSTHMKLIYRASRDGWHASDFHRLCNSIGATIFIIRTTKGKICGGYTSARWSNGGMFGGRHVKDTNAFAFSVDNKTVYKPNAKNAVLHSVKRGPNIGQRALYLREDPMNA